MVSSVSRVGTDRDDTSAINGETNGSGSRRFSIVSQFSVARTTASHDAHAPHTPTGPHELTGCIDELGLLALAFAPGEKHHATDASRLLGSVASTPTFLGPRTKAEQGNTCSERAGRSRGHCQCAPGGNPGDSPRGEGNHQEHNGDHGRASSSKQFHRELTTLQARRSGRPRVPSRRDDTTGDVRTA